ncbi:glutamate receptor ionotropic, delta-2-like [Euwallacea fornicatus]|uniref:glutamate receptor ionotropic, delta-2-like n=1 Tax=Euwallacea fornicatus TaxID=995702 RepID=UPI00338E55B5
MDLHKSHNPLAMNIARHLFNLIFENANTLCYIYEKDVYLKEPLLKQIGKPLVMLEFKNETIIRSRYMSRCQGYILNINRFKSFKALLKRRDSSTDLIRNRRRMAILYNDKAPVRFPEFLGLYALDVMELEVYYDKQISLKGYRVVRLESDEVVFQWGVNDKGYSFDGKKFAQRAWNAGSFFKKFNYTFKFAMFNCEPFIYVDADKGVLGGPEVSLAREMTRGYPVEFVFPDRKIANPWSYVLSTVETKKSDMAGCSQFVTNMGKNNVDFTLNMNQICNTFLVPKARPLPAAFFLVQPFNFNVWVASSFLMIFATLTLLVFMKYWGKFSNCKSALPETDYSSVLISVVRAYSFGNMQLSRHVSRIWSIRLSFLCLIFHSFLTSTYYNAGLSSNIAIPRLGRQINTLQDIVDNGLVFQEKSYIQKDFIHVNSSLFNNLALLYRQGDRTKTILDGTSVVTVKTLENSYVTDLYGFKGEELQNYRALKECIGNFYMGFALQINSPFKREFDRVAQKIMESGIMKKWLNDRIYPEKRVQDPFFSSFNSNVRYTIITSERLFGVFVLLIVGYVLSCISLVFEILYCEE